MFSFPIPNCLRELASHCQTSCITACIGVEYVMVMVIKFVINEDYLTTFCENSVFNQFKLN